MKKFENILIIIALFSLVLKLLSIPGMNLFLVISILILATLYFYLGFALFNDVKFSRILKKNSYSGISGLRVLGAIGVGIALSIICIGILFKIQHWNGANLYLYVGLAMACFSLIIALVKYIISKVDFYKKISIKLTVYILVSIISLIIKI